MKWLCIAPFVLVPVLPGSLRVESSADLWSIPVAAAAFGGGALGLWLAERKTRERESCLGDRIVLRAGRLVVLRDGVENSYPWPPRRMRGEWKRKEPFAFRAQSGESATYEVDTRYLITAPTEADLAEIAAAGQYVNQ